MEEISLLKEALKQPDQPFLVVIVGESNSGKCIVITRPAGHAVIALSCATDCISYQVQEVVPSMEEISLLREALNQLDQPFLVVTVGEFNSGKSTVINALLGMRFLAEGILPTTNEISVLKFRWVSNLE